MTSMLEDYPRLSRWYKEFLKVEEGVRRQNQRVDSMRTWPRVAGIEGGGNGPLDKESGWSLEAEKGQEMGPPLGPPGKKFAWTIPWF